MKRKFLNCKEDGILLSILIMFQVKVNLGAYYVLEAPPQICRYRGKTNTLFGVFSRILPLVANITYVEFIKEYKGMSKTYFITKAVG